MEQENKFYVYEWYNKDTNEVFYVGKGCGNRYKKVQERNLKFKDYYNSHNTDVRIVKNNLTEEEAFAWEKIITKKYKAIGQCQCSLAEPGTGGCSFTWTPEMKEYFSTYNPMKQEKQRQRMKENNPMKNPDIAKKMGATRKRIVIIDGVEYPSVIEAAEAFGVKDGTIRNWCLKGINLKGQTCQYKEEWDKKPGGAKKPVLIDGKDYYNSATEAALALGVDPASVRGAIKRKGKCKGHVCEYVNQQPSEENSDKSILEGSTTNE